MGPTTTPRPPIVEYVPSYQQTMLPVATSDPYQLGESDPILTEVADRGGSSIPIGHPLKEQATISTELRNHACLMSSNSGEAARSWTAWVGHAIVTCLNRYGDPRDRNQLPTNECENPQHHQYHDEYIEMRKDYSRAVRDSNFLLSWPSHACF